MKEKLRIGIDAKWYFTGPVSTQTILHNLLPELFRLYPQHEWVLYLDKRDKPMGFPLEGDNISLRYVWADNNMISNIYVLPKFVEADKLDVVVFQTFPSHKVKIPSIAFIHDVLFRDYPQFFTLKEKLYFKPLSWLAPKATRLIATTKSVANDLIKYKYTRDSSRIDIVPLGVSSLFKPIEKYRREKLVSVRDKFRMPLRFFLFVGRLNARKNIANLLKAFLLMKEKSTPLIIVGKRDWKSPKIEKLLDHPELRRRVKIIESMTDEELATTYALSSVFCFPSFAEGFGLPPLEAMASGVPPIVAKNTAVAEVCGDAGVYINPHEPQSIANALDKLAGDSEFHANRVLASQERAAQFSWTKTAHAFMDSILNATKGNVQ